MDKTKVVESTKDLGRDLAGVIAIQRKLSGLERDVAAIQTRLGTLERESQRLMASHPEQKKDIEQRQAYVEELWQGPKTGLEEPGGLPGSQPAAGLPAGSGCLQAWLATTQKDVASRTCPSPPGGPSSSCSSMQPSGRHRQAPGDLPES